jgi:hypothetical protein
MITNTMGRPGWYRQGEEAVGADRIDQRRHGDDGIGGIEVAADQEPGDPGAEVAAAQTPLIEVGALVAGPAIHLEARKPITVTRAKKNRKTHSAVQWMLAVSIIRLPFSGHHDRPAR